MLDSSTFRRANKLNSTEIFLNVVREYERMLTTYARVLDEKIPRKMEMMPELNSQETRLICKLINTCEYVSETLPSLEEQLKKVRPVVAVTAGLSI